MTPFDRAPSAAPEAGTEKAALQDLQREEASRLMQVGLREWYENPLATRDARVNTVYGAGMLQKLKGFYDQARVAVPAAQTVVEQSFAHITSDTNAADRLAEICEHLTTEPPADPEEEPGSEHAYLWRSTIPPLAEDPDDPSAAEPLPLYQVNAAAVKKDIRFLSDLRAALPATTDPAVFAAYDTLINQLNAYQFLDPKVAVRARVNALMGGRTTMDLGGRKMGRTALTAILIAGTFITGAVGLAQFIRNGKISLAPFLWGFAAWFMADPNLMKSFFDKDDPIRKDFAEVARVTSNKALQRLTRTYGIGGPAWAGVVEDIYDDAHGTILTVPYPTDAMIERTATDLARGDAHIALTLRRMLSPATRDGATGKTDFALFVESLRAVDRDDAKQFVADFVRADSFRDPRLGPRPTP